MVEGDPTIPAGALEDIAYLSRSANRIRILDALARGSYARRELAELTDVSRTTLDRIVNELEDRGWAERTTDGEYAATPTGNHLMAQVRPFVDGVEAVRRLDEALAWLPDDLSVGLHHFSDAVLRRPEQDDPMETVDYFTDLLRDTVEFRALTHLAPPVPNSRIMCDRITTGRMTGEFVVTDGLLEYLRSQPERRSRWRDILERADVFHTPGPIPCNLWIFDDLVLIKKSGPEPFEDAYGVPIESENEAVLSWAHDMIDGCRADATRVDVGTFADEAAVPKSEPGEE